MSGRVGQNVWRGRGEPIDLVVRHIGELADRVNPFRQFLPMMANQHAAI